MNGGQNAWCINRKHSKIVAQSATALKPVFIDVPVLDRNDALHDALVCLKLLECQQVVFHLPYGGNPTTPDSCSVIDS
jgi:hypothetical protein